MQTASASFGVTTGSRWQQYGENNVWGDILTMVGVVSWIRTPKRK
jgi:hypothetical protein